MIDESITFKNIEAKKLNKFYMHKGKEYMYPMIEFTFVFIKNGAKETKVIDMDPNALYGGVADITSELVGYGSKLEKPLANILLEIRTYFSFHPDIN